MLSEVLGEHATIFFTLGVDSLADVDQIFAWSRQDQASRALANRLDDDALADAFHAGHGLVGSILTRVEVLAGTRPGEEAATDRLLALFAWIPVDEAIADRAGELRRQYLRSHPGVDPVDLVIAATVEHLGAELWTRNLKHFPMLAKVRDPYGP